MLELKDERGNPGHIAKRKYKEHKNGSGILRYNCKQCGDEMNDVGSRSSNPEICNDCKFENKKLLDRMRYHIKKVNGSKKNNKAILSMEALL